jgi:MerC mercury resistance protein
LELARRRLGTDRAPFPLNPEIYAHARFRLLRSHLHEHFENAEAEISTCYLRRLTDADFPTRAGSSLGVEKPGQQDGLGSSFVTLGTFLQRQLCLSFISHFKMAVSDATGRNAQIEYITSIKRLLTFLDGIGSVGALFAAIAAPCCFPLFAGVITAVGVVALGKSEGFALYAFQGFGLLSLLGLALAVRQHRSPWPFVLGVTSVAALAWSFYGTFSHLALYGGLFGLLAATFWNRFLMRSRMCDTPD